MNSADRVWLYLRIIIAIVFVVLFLSRNIALATKEALPLEWQTLILNVYFDGKRVRLDPNFPRPIGVSITPVQPIPSGNFSIEARSAKNNLLFQVKYAPDLSSSLLYLPYYLNIGAVSIVDPDGNPEIINLKSFAVCNENDQCETSEEGLCPLDCKTTHNPFYPQTPAGQFTQSPLPATQPLPDRQPPQPLQTPAFTPETSQRQFQVSLGFVATGLLVILVIFGLVYWYNKKGR